MLLGRLRALLLASSVALLAPSVVAKAPSPKSPVAKAPSPKSPVAKAPSPKPAAKTRPQARVLPKKQAATKRTGARARKPSPPRPAPRRSNPFLEVPASGEAEQTPAYAYANMTNAEAYAELTRRNVPFRRELPGPGGVRAPVRLTGELHGVDVHSSLPADERAATRYEVLDARLALALDDFSELLARHEIVELVHYTMYRPGASPLAASDSLPTRHPGGLAIDVGALRKRDGTWLTVEQVWRTDIGARTCGAGAKQHENPLASELVDLVCEASKRRLFHYVLTPHYDKAHHDHLHLEIKPAVKWFLVN